MSDPFVYHTRVAFHETDAMGVVHHSNYINFFEEARVAWLREKGLMHLHAPQGELIFAVVDVNCRYAKPLKFEDEVAVAVEVRHQGVRIIFRYAVFSRQGLCSQGETTLVPVTVALEVTRLPMELREFLRAAPWSEAWPPASSPFEKSLPQS